MKFFGEISEFKIKANQLSIYIPHYHRAATGLLSHTYVYAVPRVSKNPSGKKIKEIILTPYSPSTWINLYRLEYKAKDKPGVNNIITSIFKDLGINIYTQESLTSDRENLHTVSVIVDLEKLNLNGGNDLTTEITKLGKEIKSSLATQNIKIELEKIEPMRFLHNNFETNNGKHNLINQNELRNYFWRGYRSNPIMNKSVQVGKDILFDLEIIDENLKPNRVLQGTIISDTEDKYILIRFFRPEQFVIHLNIVHKNVVGSIFKFTEIISQCEKEFNILSCYNRIEDVKNNAHWYVMLDVSSNPSKVLDLIKELKAKVKHVDRVKVVDFTENFHQKGIDIPESERAKLERLKDEKKAKKNLDEKNKLREENEKHLLREVEYQKIIKDDMLGKILVASSIFIFGIWVFLREFLTENLGVFLAIVSGFMGVITFTSALFNIYNQIKNKKNNSDNNSP